MKKSLGITLTYFYPVRSEKHTKLFPNDTVNQVGSELQQRLWQIVVGDMLITSGHIWRLSKFTYYQTDQLLS